MEARENKFDPALGMTRDRLWIQGLCSVCGKRQAGVWVDTLRPLSCHSYYCDLAIDAPVTSQEPQDSPIVARVDELLSTPEDGTFWCKSERYPTFESYLAAGRPKHS